jgi:hypothetical protein
VVINILSRKNSLDKITTITWAFSFVGNGTTRLLRTFYPYERTSVGGRTRLLAWCCTTEDNQKLYKHDLHPLTCISKTTTRIYRFPRKRSSKSIASIISRIFRIGGCVMISFSRFKMLQHAVVMTWQHLTITWFWHWSFSYFFIERETSRTSKAQCSSMVAVLFCLALNLTEDGPIVQDRSAIWIRSANPWCSSVYSLVFSIYIHTTLL